jgi:hypothetical protein
MICVMYSTGAMTITQDQRELIRGFCACIVSLILNAFVLTMYEVRVRTKYNASAVSEDDALKQRFGLAPPPSQASDGTPLVPEHTTKPEAVTRANK